MIAHFTARMSERGGGIAFALRDLVGALGDGHEIHALDDGATPLAQTELHQRMIRGVSADLIHTHGLWTTTSISAPRAGKPWIVSPHGMLDPWALANSRLKKKLALWLFEKRHLHGAHCLHALCEPEAKAIRDFGLTQPIATIPNGVHLPDALPDRRDRAERTMLFLGRLHPKKGLAEFLQSWREVNPSNWRLVVVGWDQGNHEAELRNLAEGLKVDFPGPAFGEEKERLLQEADGFVLPSHSEGLPVAILEAWSWGLPVLMTDACNLPEGFASESAMRYQDADSLRAFLAEDLQKMGENGRQLVSERFTWERIARQFNELYRWVLGEADQPVFVS